MRMARSVARLLVALTFTSCAMPPEEEPVDEAESAATVPSSFADSAFVSGLSSPTAMEFAPDGRLFVCQQGGALRVIKNGTLLSTPFLSLSVDTQGERGLLGVAFDPNFSSEKWVYVYYTVTGTIHNRVSRFKVSSTSADVGDKASEQVLLNLPNLGAIYHNGGAIHFGSDGKLYIALGDNKSTALDSAGNRVSQSKSSLLGKILRINKDGTIPTDNPFFTSTSGNNRAIWVMGLRNPFTFSFQPGTTRMMINDVGEATWEEVNDGIKGSNYGWPTTEGSTSNTAFRSPLFKYGSRTTDSASGKQNCAIIGSAFYNPTTQKFPSSYVGKYFFADYCGAAISMLDLSSKARTNFASGVSSLVDLKVGADGLLYYLQHGGTVRRITYTGTVAQPPTITDQPISKTVSVGQSATFTVGATGSGTLTYQWQRNQVNISGATGSSFTLSNAQTGDSGAKFRAKVTNANGTSTSSEATLTVTTNKAPTPTITAPLAGTTYKAGQTINYAGKGTDPEDGTIPATAMTWQVDFHHDTHVHPFIAATTGASSGSFVVPTANEVAPTVWYRIYLTVKDKGGLSTQTFVDVKPVTVNFTLASNPTGLQVSLEGQPMVTPKVVTGVVGITRQLGAPSPQSLNGKTYVFKSWSDGGAVNHNISTPASATTYTATFVESSLKIYEAENAALSGAVVSNTKAGFTGTGFADYVNASGDFVEFTVNAATAGTYTLVFRYSNASVDSRPLSISVGGKVVNASLAFPSTGDWTVWKTVSLSTALVAGANKVRATAIGSSGPNLDHLEGP
jgi:glucose/arabinose dehydrogenase